MDELKIILNKLIVVGVGVLITTIPFWVLESGDPYTDYQLIRHGKTTTAKVIKNWEEVEEWDGGHKAAVVNYCIYRFSVPGGNSFSKRTRGADLYAGDTVKVEYVPGNPHISRLAGTGHSTMRRWLLGLPMFAFFVVFCGAVGISIILTGWRDLVKELKAARSI